MKKSAMILSMILVMVCGAYAQELGDGEVEQGSAMSKIMKSSGSLLVRESHYLPALKTTLGEDIECEIMILKNLLSSESKEDLTLGLVLKAKEKYSTKSANIDPDEIEGLLASLELIQSEGLALVTTPSITSPKETGSSIELHYRTKDGMVLGVYESKGKMKYALKVTSTADWAYVSPKGITTLISNLKAALELFVGLHK